MGLPAARMGDPAGHGGVILPPGAPTVFIGGMPAARLGDMIACPGFDGPKPHVMGNIVMGSTTVKIYGAFAARQTDSTGCGIVGVSGMSMPASVGCKDSTKEHSEWSEEYDVEGGKIVVSFFNNKTSDTAAEISIGKVEFKEDPDFLGVVRTTEISVGTAELKLGGLLDDDCKTGLAIDFSAQVNGFSGKQKQSFPEIPLDSFDYLFEFMNIPTPDTNGYTVKVEGSGGFSAGAGIAANIRNGYNKQDNRMEIGAGLDAKLIGGASFDFLLSVGKKDAPPSMSIPGVGVPMTPGTIIMGCPTVRIG